MRKAKDKVGALVQVPVYQFAPNRNGWNGWIFSIGIIRRKYVSAKGYKCYEVEYVNRHKKDGSSMFKNFIVENVFDAGDVIGQAQRIIDKYSREQFDNATGVNWILFLVNNGLVNLKESQDNK